MLNSDGSTYEKAFAMEREYILDQGIIFIFQEIDQKIMERNIYSC